MREFRKLADRLADQAKAREKLAERARKLATKRGETKPPLPKPKTYSLTPPVAQVTTARPWAQVRAGSAGLRYYARSTDELLLMQPWAEGLVNTLLSAADESGVTLCLVWPAKLASLPYLHA